MLGCWLRACSLRLLRGRLLDPAVGMCHWLRGLFHAGPQRGLEALILRGDRGDRLPMGVVPVGRTGACPGQGPSAPGEGERRGPRVDPKASLRPGAGQSVQAGQGPRKRGVSWCWSSHGAPCTWMAERWGDLPRGTPSSSLRGAITFCVSKDLETKVFPRRSRSVPVEMSQCMARCLRHAS